MCVLGKIFVTLMVCNMLFMVSTISAMADCWAQKRDMPTPRWGLSLSAPVICGWIYVVGGSHSDTQALSDVEAYNPNTDKWVKVAYIPTPRWYLSTCAVNGKLYAIAGSTNKQAGVLENTAMVEQYDPGRDSWMEKASISCPRRLCSTCAVNGKIYVMGGWPTKTTVEEYDPVTDTWTQKADMPTAREGFGTAVVGGKIYAIGGGPDDATPISSVEEYDPVTDTWTQKADMPTARFAPVGVLNGKIYVIGGFTHSWKILSTVEEYDPETDTWTQKTDMPTERIDASVGAVNGKIYVIGGSRLLPSPLPTVEEYTPDEWLSAVPSIEKLAKAWGSIKQSR